MFLGTRSIAKRVWPLGFASTCSCMETAVHIQVTIHDAHTHTYT